MKVKIMSNAMFKTHACSYADSYESSRTYGRLFLEPTQHAQRNRASQSPGSLNCQVRPRIPKSNERESTNNREVERIIYPKVVRCCTKLGEPSERGTTPYPVLASRALRGIPTDTEQLRRERLGQAGAQKVREGGEMPSKVTPAVVMGQTWCVYGSSFLHLRRRRQMRGRSPKAKINARRIPGEGRPVLHLGGKGICLGTL